MIDTKKFGLKTQEKVENVLLDKSKVFCLTKLSHLPQWLYLNSIVSWGYWKAAIIMSHKPSFEDTFAKWKL